jgi:hypothetical protein
MQTAIDVGPEAKLAFSVIDDQLQIVATYGGKQLTAGAQIAMTIDQLCEALAALIPGDSALEKGFIGSLRVGLGLANTKTDPAKLAAALEAGKDLQAKV